MTSSASTLTAPQGAFLRLNTMSEYLNSTELHQLTGYARSTQQTAWLKFRCIPHKQDGSRVIVSRVHVQSWLEGKPTLARTGMNIAAIR
jgi:hypothetical protein